MSEDRTTPMRQPNWSQQPADSDDLETVYTDPNKTPPTVPLGDQEGWGQRRDWGFARTAATEGATPQGPPYEAPGDQQAHTVLISERPTPVFAWLVVVEGPDRGSIGKVHTLHPDTTTLGRVQGNSIVLHDDTCSAQHARIRAEGRENKETAFVIFDMGSRNGIYVGDKESYRDDESRTYRHELQDGDYLLLGETTLVFKKL